MSVEFPRAGNMTGCLLVAHPQLLDPNFRRTIVYLSHHSAEDGALGLVLNRPLQKTVGEVADPARDTPLEVVPVFEGGPVERDRLLVATVGWNLDNSGFALRNLGDNQELEHLDETHRDALRAFVGYAGWSSGQLEAEIAQKSWFVLQPTRNLTQAENSADTWKRLMREFGPLFSLLAEMPDDPSLN